MFAPSNGTSLFLGQKDGQGRQREAQCGRLGLLTPFVSLGCSVDLTKWRRLLERTAAPSFNASGAD
jgi:hypothetical protein